LTTEKGTQGTIGSFYNLGSRPRIDLELEGSPRLVFPFKEPFIVDILVLEVDGVAAER